jgi:hypothetical protein
VTSVTESTLVTHTCPNSVGLPFIIFIQLAALYFFMTMYHIILYFNAFNKSLILAFCKGYSIKFVTDNFVTKFLVYSILLLHHIGVRH